MATLLQALTAHLPMERTHRQLGIRNPILKALADPVNLAGLGALGAGGIGLGMAKAAGRGAAKQAMQASQRRVAKSILGGEVAEDAAPVFYSRLARALAASDPNQRVRTMRDLEKIGLKGGGASRGEMTLLGERLGALKPVSTEALAQGKPAPPAITWDEEIPLTAAAKRRGAPENTVADILTEMEEAAPLELLDIPHAPKHEQYTVPGGTQYAESLLHVPEDRPYLFGLGDETVPPTTLEALAAYGPTRSGHFPGSLSFALRKNRPMLNDAGEQIGTARSLEQIQSDMMQRGKKMRSVLEETRPDLAKDLQKRWPAIALGRELRRAADEGLDAVTWHPAERVMKHNPGETSGMQPFYGTENDPAQLGNIAKKMAKGIPGAEVRPVSVPDAGDAKTMQHLPGYVSNAIRQVGDYSRLGMGYDEIFLMLPPGMKAVYKDTGEVVDTMAFRPVRLLQSVRRVLGGAGQQAEERRLVVDKAIDALNILEHSRDFPLSTTSLITSKLANTDNTKLLNDVHKALLKIDGGDKLWADLKQAINADDFFTRIDNLEELFEYFEHADWLPFGEDYYVEPILDAITKHFPDEMAARRQLRRVMFPPNDDAWALSDILNTISPGDYSQVLDDLGVTVVDRGLTRKSMQQWGITLNEEAREWLRNNPLRLLGLGGASAVPLSVAAARNRSA